MKPEEKTILDGWTYLACSPNMASEDINKLNNDAWTESLNIKAKELYPGDGKSEIIDRAKYVASKVIDNAIFWTTGITKCHCWKNYAGEELRNVWVTLEDYQKDAIRKSLEEVARNEEWD